MLYNFIINLKFLYTFFIFYLLIVINNFWWNLTIIEAFAIWVNLKLFQDLFFIFITRYTISSFYGYFSVIFSWRSGHSVILLTIIRNFIPNLLFFKFNNIFSIILRFRFYFKLTISMWGHLNLVTRIFWGSFVTPFRKQISRFTGLCKRYIYTATISNFKICITFFKIFIDRLLFRGVLFFYR